jgi:hypothetical protein
VRTGGWHPWVRLATPTLRASPTARAEDDLEIGTHRQVGKIPCHSRVISLIWDAPATTAPLAGSGGYGVPRLHRSYWVAQTAGAFYP